MDNNIVKCHVCGCRAFLYPNNTVVPHYRSNGKKCSANMQPWQDTRTVEEKSIAAVYADRSVEAIYNDAMIAHKWFGRHFGEQMNGRDFAVKCEMADRILAELYSNLETLSAELQGLRKDYENIPMLTRERFKLQ